jgi:hypothetical protein
MIRRLAARLARMDRAEIASRGTAAARAIAGRIAARVVAPRWRREDLLPALARASQLTAVRASLAGRRWDDAHRELARRFAAAPRRFVVAPSDRKALRDRILGEYSGAAVDAAARADRILAGRYDLLGYRGLVFNPDPSGVVRPDPTNLSDPSDLSDLSDPSDLSDLSDLSGLSGPPAWDFDPVHDRRAPALFWVDVPYLAPACGDHKIVWELNRHQHWIALGRAFWLTGEAKYRDRFVAELASWLNANPPLVGINWASMLELGLRSISWIWAIQLFVNGRSDGLDGLRKEGSDDGGDAWLVDLLVALDRQLTHIEQNLSYYFSPNTHLLGEALALYVAARVLPELAGSARREQIGRDILIGEIGRQIGRDGGHSERSTHYHRYTLDFYAMALIVARNTGDEAAAGPFAEVVERLGAAARLLADDAGRVPHIGDDDGGALLPLTGSPTDDLRASLAVAAALVNRPVLQIGPAPEEALWMLGATAAVPSPQALVMRSAALPDTGYYVSRSALGHHLIVDGGPHGYQNAGHAHADALSLTLSIHGLPLLIDPGTGCYTVDTTLRDRLRSTPFHNTLTLDDRPQSIPNGPFQWSRVANTRVHAWRTHDRFDYFDGSQDGYRPLEHRRRLFALHGDLIVVVDLVTPALNAESAANAESEHAAHAAGARCRTRMHTAALHWHLDAGWTFDARARGATLMRAASDGRAIRVGLSLPQGLLEPYAGDQHTGLGWCSPEYGRLDTATTLRVTQSGAAPFWMATVFDLDPENPVADVDWVPVWAEAGTVAHATALRITRATSVDHMLFAEPCDEVLNAADFAPTALRQASPKLDATNDERRRETAEAADKTSSSAHSANTACKRGRWRVGETETDARMLFSRTAADGRVTAIAMADGTFVRTPGRGGPDIALGLTAADFFWTTDQTRTRDQEPGTKDEIPCVALPVS